MKKTLTKITIAYYVVYIAAVLAATAGYYILKEGVSIDAQSQTGITISSALIIFIIGSIPVTLGLFHRYSKKIATLEDVQIKVKKYEMASYLRLTIIGLGLILGVLFFYILHSQSMLFCAGIAAIALFFCKPSISKMINDIDLDDLND
ncbi:MAG: hypothetical protein VB126_10215 [Paludibacter sp.]|nr:hypothetical protein [Paludibacter sp.]